MRRNKGASVPDQALAVPATPANAVDGPSSFDPSRIGALDTPIEQRWVELFIDLVIAGWSVADVREGYGLALPPRVGAGL